MEKINIILGKDQKLFFTSDSHFGHRNVIRFCDRPFEDDRQMTEELIKRWNNVVKKDDFVFSLGDFSWWTDRHGVKRLVDKLNGKKFFIPGNHCTRRMYELCDPESDRGTFYLCEDTTVLYLRGQEDDLRFANCKLYEIVLHHYPLNTWSHVDRGSLQFFGHIHSLKGRPMTEFGDPLPFLREKQQFDVGCDRHDYAPVEFFEVLDEMNKYPYWDLHKIKES